MPAHTVVFQSYRTSNVPEWMNRCMLSARQWAAQRGFDYEFYDDEFFELFPPEFRDRTDNKVLMSDFCRLIATREFLARGYQRVVWIDADVVVFDPESWVLPTDDNFYFCHELWPIPREGGVALEHRINNAVMVFSRGNVFLECYIDLCRRILMGNDPLKNWHLGVRFLTAMRMVVPMPLLRNIGMLGAAFLEDIYKGNKLLIASYMRGMGVPLVAANCCSSTSGVDFGEFALTDSVYDEIIDQLISTRGLAINQYLTAPV